jgi:hypothetical protein
MPVPPPVSWSLPGGSRCPRGGLVQDHVALAEIELCGELMIAASGPDAAGVERLSAEEIDRVLRVMEAEVSRAEDDGPARPGGRP